VKIIFEHWWSTFPPISTKWKTNSHLKQINTDAATGIVLSMFMLSFILMSVWSLWVEANICRFLLLVCIYIVSGDPIMLVDSVGTSLVADVYFEILAENVSAFNLIFCYRMNVVFAQRLFFYYVVCYVYTLVNKKDLC
jgi:hypothetical protein